MLWKQRDRWNVERKDHIRNNHYIPRKMRRMAHLFYGFMVPLMVCYVVRTWVAKLPESPAAAAHGNRGDSFPLRPVCTQPQTHVAATKLKYMLFPSWEHTFLSSGEMVKRKCYFLIAQATIFKAPASLGGLWRLWLWHPYRSLKSEQIKGGKQRR